MAAELFPHSQELLEAALSAILLALLRHFAKNRKLGVERDAKVERAGKTAAETGQRVELALARFGGQLETNAAKTEGALSALNARCNRLERDGERLDERIRDLEHRRDSS